MSLRTPSLRPGARVRLHQAFRCCPYAGAVSSQLADYLEQNGLQLVDNDEEAEVHLVHSCGSDARQAALSFDRLAALRAQGDAPVVLTGCLSRIDPRGVEAALAPFSTAARLGPSELGRLDALLGAPAVPWAAVRPGPTRPYAGNDFSDGYRHVVASVGCLGTCGFCAIRRATGRPQSRPIQHILHDIDEGLALGQHEPLIVSTDLSAWGVDLGLSVVDLVAALDAHRPGELLFAAEGFEPTLLLQHGEALLPLLSSGRWSVLGLPIQSGSARVLRRMARSYDPEAVLDWVRRLKARAPETLLRTDLLYGFADETEAEFEQSLATSRHFDLPSFNLYQPRPGTEPRLLPEATLADRRDRANAELYARAQAGWPALRRFGRASEAPQLQAQSAAAQATGPGPTTPSPTSIPGTEPIEAPAPAAPWDRPEGQAWIAARAARCAERLRRPVPLAEGWRLVGASAGPDAVLLSAARGEDRVELGLRPRAWPGEGGWRSGQLRLWLRGPAAPPSFGPALSALVAALSRSAEPARPEDPADPPAG